MLNILDQYLANVEELDSRAVGSCAGPSASDELISIVFSDSLAQISYLKEIHYGQKRKISRLCTEAATYMTHTDYCRLSR